MGTSLPNELGERSLSPSPALTAAAKLDDTKLAGASPRTEWWLGSQSEPIPESDIAPRYELLLGLVVVATVGNFALMPFVEGVGGKPSLQWIAYAWIGMTGAQFVIHSALFCLWNRPLKSRAAWAAMSGLPPCVAFICGALLEVPLGQMNARHVRELVGVIGCVPLFLLAAQSPFWMIRFGFRGRIERRAIAKTERRSEVWRIRDLFIGTTVVATLLTLMKVSKPDSVNGNDYYPSILIAFGVVSVISLVAALPTVMAILRGSTLWMPLLGVLLLNVATYVAVMMVGTLASGTPPASAYFQVAWLVFGFSGSVAGVFIVIRRCGYRLYFGHEEAGFGKGTV